MSIKIKRIQSNESGPFTVASGETVAHFHVPSSLGFTDLENSCLVLRMKAQCDTNPGRTNANIPVCIGEKVGTTQVTASVMGAQALIRTSTAKGLESNYFHEQRDQNVISANLDFFTKSRDSGHAMEAYNGNSNFAGTNRDVQGLAQSPFLRMSKPENFDVPQTNVSEKIYAEIRVPFKHIDRVADGNRQFPNVAVGDIEYTVQLEDVRSVINSCNNQTDYVLGDVTSDGSNKFGSAAAPLLYEIEVGEPITEGTMKQLPFYVGEPVYITYEDAGAKNHHAEITSLNVNSGTGKLEIVVDPPCPASGTGVAGTNFVITLTVASDATYSYEVRDMYLEMHCLQLTPNQLEMARKALSNMQLPWLDHRLVKMTLSATTDYSEQIQLERGCCGLAVITPNNNGLVSGTDDAHHYRFSIDGKETTNREIDCGPAIRNNGVGQVRQLHNYMLQKWFKNINKKLQRYDSPSRNYNHDVEKYTHHIFPLVTPIVDRNQMVNFQCRTDSGALMAGKEVFYLQVIPKVLTFKDGQLQ